MEGHAPPKTVVNLIAILLEAALLSTMAAGGPGRWHPGDQYQGQGPLAPPQDPPALTSTEIWCGRDVSWKERSREKERRTTAQRMGGSKNGVAGGCMS